ncbi:hypothetical protein [Oceanospirillum maris]|uniref:hypothetical protein n=1 Tax=Oceanospirillum maris TaxID=64977 RepID=UPI000403193C|nr:hypothetical protein [Oceanospirillum maris]
MPIADQQYQQWLSQPNQPRVVLAELEHSAGTEYVSSRPYISQPTDSAPNRIYDDLLQGELEISARLDSQLELGALDLVDDGSITHWVNRRWRGYTVVLKLGDPSWSLDDFRIIARQINSGILDARRGKIQLGIYDAAAQLQQEIQRPELPSGQPVPLILGRVFCAPATRISTSTLTYRVSWLPVTSLVVRDGNGPVISHTADYSSGQFVASSYSPRTLMCEVVEPHQTPLQIVHWVADQYSIPLASGLNLPGYTLGLRYDGAVTGAQVLDDVCTAIGGHWKINALGELTVSVFELPGAEPDLIIDADDIEFGQIALTETQEPLKTLTLNYARNHNLISEVAGSITATDAERLMSEWLAVSGSNSAADYPLAPDQSLDTALQTQAHALTERNRRLQIKSTRHDVYRITVLRPGLQDIVGQVVRMDHPRTAGRIGRVISSRSNPLRDKTELEIWY